MCSQPRNKALHPCAASDHLLPPWTNAHFCLFPLWFCFLLYITRLCSLAAAPRIWHHFNKQIQTLAGVHAGVIISAPSIRAISHEFHSYLHTPLFSPEKRSWARAASGSVFESPVLSHSFLGLWDVEQEGRAPCTPFSSGVCPEAALEHGMQSGTSAPEKLLAGFASAPGFSS